MKKILLITTLGFLTFLSRANNEKDEIIKLADKDKQNSTFFKMSRNSNRVAIFEQLQSLIKVKNTKSNFAAANGQNSGFFSMYDDVVEILGEPNVKVKNTLIYTLNPSNGCKAIIEIDANRAVVYLGIKDCN